MKLGPACSVLTGGKGSAPSAPQAKPSVKSRANRSKSAALLLLIGYRTVHQSFSRVSQRARLTPAGRMEVDPELGVPLMTGSKRTAAFALPTRSDALDLDGAAALTRATAPVSRAADATDDDDEFDVEIADASRSGIMPLSLPASTAAAAAVVRPTEPLSQLAASLVGADAAQGALAAVRASLAAEREREAADTAAAVEARVLATLLPSAGASSGALDAVGEEGDEDDDEGDDDERSDRGLDGGAGAAAAAATLGSTSASVADETLSADTETAALELDFEGATAAALAGLAAESRVTSGPASWPALSTIIRDLSDAAALAPLLPQITPVAVDPSAGCFERLFSVRLLPALEPARDVVFALAKRVYDGAAPSQTALMGALFERLTGRSANAPGAVWTAIGFQREHDFTTDLRGVGMFGPMQVYAALEEHATVIASLWAVAVSPLQPFPFIIQCFALSAKTLQALRVGKLSRAINAAAAAASASAAPENSNIVLRVANDWFAGLCNDFAAAWRADPQASISRIGHIQLQVIARAMRDADGVLARLAARKKKEKERARAQ